MTEPLVTVFVYGTLKTGGCFHEGRTDDFLGRRKARVQGRLWAVRESWPTLEVPKGLVLARASTDPLADARLTGHFAREVRTPSLEAPWRWIDGEVLTFVDPARKLSLLDAFEGATAEAPVRLLDRVLLPVIDDNDRWLGAWAYVAPDAGPPAGAVPWPKGSWPAEGGEP